MGTMDELINSTVVDHLRSSLHAVQPTLDLSTLTETRTALGEMRLRDRVDLVRDALLTDLPSHFASSERIVQEVLSVPEFAGWMIWPTTEFVAARALEDGSTGAFDAAMMLLARLTVGLSSEFAIRDMLIARPERALGIIRTWTEHENEHVRRLTSEGTRAYLPWAKRVPWLIENPDATRGILDTLYRDAAEYVRRSVANHLNDLSRVDPALVTRTAQGWTERADAHTPWVIRRGLRTLVKNADPEALTLLGYSGTRLRVGLPQLSSTTVRFEEALTFTAVITNDGDTDATVAIDYSIGFLRSNGTISPKTFKLTSRTIAPGESVTVAKIHSFRRITTRTYYPGTHFVTVQANGTRSPRADFTVHEASGDPSASRGDSA
ncbi:MULTISPECIES: DNA alkylation repair protein [unclassified Rathayibacter]|uniref:DNA alkylation repair protein n=1 Tax=unclassified Rathayibacter TaxID=2609250 RepID=UPI00188A0640|nr:MULTISPECIES: DNA alkylation repair protein [unclassified Rathayibacter]MBF4461761.1 DNA alkylation repair protein [Rathayibacter sp. VKM Ac-2879]MBF4503173.1 DNA alkylation repair protein [Rathayibacter sp. VKM Ac-2878]